MKRAFAGRLRDILRAIDEITEVSEGITFKAYQADFRVRRIVERCVEIVSEASRHIPAEMKAKHPAVPWGAIWNIGNRLRHEYGYSMIASCGGSRPTQYGSSARQSSP